MSRQAEPGGKRQIVSSAHLVSERAAELSAYEYGLILAANAFDRWTVRCMTAAGHPELGALDILVLHSVNHRDRAKRLSDICFVLDIEDSHTVNYALKKLEKLSLVSRSRRGKETLYSPSPTGTAACLKYRELREDCLVTAFEAFAGGQGGDVRGQINETAELLRVLSGLYDQAARAAASL
jgi:predicted MarR family transcription regulator